MGDGTARGGRLSCKQKIRWVQFPYLPLNKIIWGYGLMVDDVGLSIRRSGFNSP